MSFYHLHPYALYVDILLVAPAVRAVLAAAAAARAQLLEVVRAARHRLPLREDHAARLDEVVTRTLCLLI